MSASTTQIIPRSILPQIQRIFRRAPQAGQILDLYHDLFEVQHGGPLPEKGFVATARQIFRSLTKAISHLFPAEVTPEVEDSLLLMSLEMTPLLRRIDRGDRSPVIFGQVSADLAEGLTNFLRPLGIFVKPFRIPGPGNFIGLRNMRPSTEVPEEIANVFLPSEKSLPKIARQPSKDLDALYAQAQEAMEQQLDLLNRGQGLDQMLGAKVIRGDLKQKPDLTKPGPLVMIGPLKGKGRVLEKLQESQAEADSILDLVRATVVVDRLEDIPKVMDLLRLSGIEIAREPKNRFAKPTSVGYRDLMFNIRYPNGHVGELQINVKAMLLAKNLGHEYYEKVRTVMAEKATLGETDLTPEEQAEIDRANAIQEHIYNEAWASVASPEPLTKSAASKTKGMSYYDYKDQAVVVAPMRVPLGVDKNGKTYPIYDIAKFYREAQELSLAEFKALLVRG